MKLQLTKEQIEFLQLGTIVKTKAKPEDQDNINIYYHLPFVFKSNPGSNMFDVISPDNLDEDLKKMII